jgi:SulP family sulfate permease
MLLLSNVRDNLPNGRNLREFLDQTGVTEKSETVRLFPELDSAIEWVEDRILGELERATPEPETSMLLAEMELFKGRKDDTLADLEARLTHRTCAAGEMVYARGEPGDALFMIRRGSVKIFAPIGAGRTRHIATFGRGDFFGGLRFLTGHVQCHEPDQFYVLSLEQFNTSKNTNAWRLPCFQQLHEPWRFLLMQIPKLRCCGTDQACCIVEQAGGANVVAE